MYIIDQRELQLLRALPHPRHQATRQLPKPEGTQNKSSCTFFYLTSAQDPDPDPLDPNQEVAKY